MDFDDPQFAKRPYDKFVAYGQSKTANILFAVAADAKGQRDNTRAFAMIGPGNFGPISVLVFDQNLT